MKRLIFATGNENKMKEIREILEGLPVQILSMKEAGIEADIVEDGLSFEENALIKARAVCKLAGEMYLLMIPVWRWIISIKSREFIRHAIWGGYVLQNQKPEYNRPSGGRSG